MFAPPDGGTTTFHELIKSTGRQNMQYQVVDTGGLA